MLTVLKKMQDSFVVRRKMCIRDRGKATPKQPDAPTKNAATADAVTLNTAGGQKYIWTTNSTPPTTSTDGWQTADGETYQFTGLTPNTDYYFWTYIPEDDYYKISPVSAAIKITTEKSCLLYTSRGV